MGLNTALTSRSNGRQRVYQVFLFLSKSLPNTQITMKVFMIAALCIAAVSADPWGYFGYGYGHPGLLKNPHLSWPGVVAPGFESTCFGCRGKRSADAEPEAEADAYYGYGGYGRYGYGGYGYGRGYGYGGYGHYLGKRSADAEAEPHYGYYGYPCLWILPIWPSSCCQSCPSCKGWCCWTPHWHLFCCTKPTRTPRKAIC